MFDDCKIHRVARTSSPAISRSILPMSSSRLMVGFGRYWLVSGMQIVHGLPVLFLTRIVYQNIAGGPNQETVFFGAHNLQNWRQAVMSPREDNSSTAPLSVPVGATGAIHRAFLQTLPGKSHHRLPQLPVWGSMTWMELPAWV